MGKKIFVCPGCKRREYIPFDKITVIKNQDTEIQKKILKDIALFLTKNFNIREEKEQYVYRANARQLFSELVNKYSPEDVVTLCFGQFIRAYANMLMKDQFPILKLLEITELWANEL